MRAQRHSRGLAVRAGWESGALARRVAINFSRRITRSSAPGLDPCWPGTAPAVPCGFSRRIVRSGQRSGGAGTLSFVGVGAHEASVEGPAKPSVIHYSLPAAAPMGFLRTSRPNPCLHQHPAPRTCAALPGEASAAPSS